ALGLAASGATVIAVARNAAQLRETEFLAVGSAGSVTGIPCDVADPAAVAALGDDVRSRFGAPTILVNAAGVFGPISLIADSDVEDWVRTIQIDAVASYLTTRAFLTGMLEAGWGRIVNVTSAASLHPPGPLNSAYGTAKVALNQFTRHLASEISGTGVTANVIHPGDVQTDMWADIRDKVDAIGPIGDGFKSWVDWVQETGGDPPGKAVDLVLRLTTDAAGDTNGRFCWIDDPLQAPIASWDEPTDERPWAK
ncbi:MAG: SDR family oxidoreductase, partial [Chloroflexi bacterium]|nr:SDR family oxidoreductase [Chloroflexota bacterium]